MLTGRDMLKSSQGRKKRINKIPIEKIVFIIGDIISVLGISFNPKASIKVCRGSHISLKKAYFK
jgi:hypothetical protein